MDDTTTITTTTTTTTTTMSAKTNAPTKPTENKKKRLNGESKQGGAGDIGCDVDKDDDEECDVEAWDTLSTSFGQVQTVLDQNRDLIKQVNANHQSKIPDNLAKNVSLIHEINGNISKVISIYSDLSVNFSNIVQERRRINDDGGGAGGGNAEIEKRDS